MTNKRERFLQNMINKTLRTICFSFLIFALLSSCMNVRPGGAKSGKRLYESFFVGDEGTQYFIKPLVFTNDMDEKLKLDFTFRYKNEIKDSATVNATFMSKEIFRNADSLKIIDGSNIVVLSNMAYLFSEKNKEVYNNRFSTKAEMLKIKNLFNGNTWKILIYKNGTHTQYMTPKKTKKSLEKLNQEVFVLF